MLHLVLDMFYKIKKNNHISALLIASSCVIGLAGCGGGSGPSPAPGSGAAPSTGRGETLALACAACHTFRAGQNHAIGPNLHDVFGRRAATRDGFEYSAALRASGFVWTPELLDQWLADPTGFVPGTTMAFAGYRRPEDRENLIAYLVQATAP